MLGFNQSSTSTEAAENDVIGWQEPEKFYFHSLEHFLLGLSVLGIIGNIFVFVVARYMVKTNRKAGNFTIFSNNSFIFRFLGVSQIHSTLTTHGKSWQVMATHGNSWLIIHDRGFLMDTCAQTCIVMHES